MEATSKMTMTLTPIGGTQDIEQAHAGWSRRRLRPLVVTGSLVAGDLISAFIAQRAGELVVAKGHADELVTTPIPFALITLMYLILGLYAEWGVGPVERLRGRIVATSLFLAANILVALLQNRLDMETCALLAAGGVCLVGFSYYSQEAIRTVLIQQGWWGVPTALIGTGPGSLELARTIVAHPEFGLRLIGFVGTAAGPDAPPTSLPLHYLGALSEADRISPRVEVAIVVSADDLAPRDTSHLLQLPFAHIVISSDPRSGAGACLRTRSLCGMIGFDVRRDIYRDGNLWLKRCLDCLVAIPLLVLASPLILVAAAVIKVLDPGPAFYSHNRLGRKGEPFGVLKLRTMYADADRRLDLHLAENPAARAEWVKYFKLSNDPRILPWIGHILRRSSLDELPQLINVVHGRMSLVGPRPFPDYHVRSFDAQFRLLRESVPPGLTGFWQISSRSEGDLSVQQAQDMFYIRNWSIWLDLYILAQTPIAVMRARGAH